MTTNVEKAVKAEQKKYERPAGAGIEVDIQVRNRLLMQTFGYTFERTDNQLAILSERKGAGEALKRIRELLDEQISSLDKYIEQVSEICRSNSVKPAFTGRVFSATTIVLTPYGFDYLNLFRKTDEAMSILHALWIAKIVDEEAFREQAHKLRARLHNTSQAVDRVFSDVLKRGGLDSSSSGEDDDSSSSGEDEDGQMVAAEAEAAHAT